MAERMISVPRTLRAAALSLAVLPITAVAIAPQAAADARGRADAGASARRMLADLRVAKPLSIRGYSHRRFQPRWAHHKGSATHGRWSSPGRAGAYGGTRRARP